MYIYIFNLGIDKGEITYMIYLEELTYIYLFIYLFRKRRSRPHILTTAPAGRTQDLFIHPVEKLIA